jgi:hypothetical protein
MWQRHRLGDRELRSAETQGPMSNLPRAFAHLFTATARNVIADKVEDFVKTYAIQVLNDWLGSGFVSVRIQEAVSPAR